MFCPYKNSYLQLPHAMNPMVVNKCVRRAMRKSQFDPHDEIPPAKRLESMQPSLYAPCVDITRARLPLSFRGLRIINKDIHSKDSFVQLQALHTLLDQVQISENAIFLIKLGVVIRLIPLMESTDPIVREKVLIILTRLCSYYQARKNIMAQPIVIEHLMNLFMQDRKEIRYVAALCMKTLAQNRCACEMIMKNEKIIDNLLKMIIKDHSGIVLLHLNTLSNLSEWDPTRPLKANAFNVLMKLLDNDDNRLVEAALDGLTQLCKHDIGQKLAEMHNMIQRLQPLLAPTDLRIATSAAGLLMYITISTKSKWRMKEFVRELTEQMVILCVKYTTPVLQMRAMQVLINMCEVPDIRNYIKDHWDHTIKHAKILTIDQWDGADFTEGGIKAGHNYRSKYIPHVASVKTDFGDDSRAVNARNYLSCLRSKKELLLKLINYTPYTD